MKSARFYFPIGIFTGFIILPLLMLGFGDRQPCVMIARETSPSVIAKAVSFFLPTAQACGNTGNSGNGGGPVNCPVAGLTPLVDPLAIQMEGGQTVIWGNTHADLQPDFNALRAAIQASGPGRDAVATSAYRPLAYQQHLWEIADRWCTQQLNNQNSRNSILCPALRQTVQAEKNKHFPTQNCPIVVAAPNACASHTRGIAVDISLTGITPAQANAIAVNLNLSLRWPDITNDPFHWQLTRNIPACP